MHIAMVGAGRMGRALGGLFAEAGHQVILANSQGPESLDGLVAELGPNCSAAGVADAVAKADVVVLATPWWKTAEAVAVVPGWTGKIVVDTTNNRRAPGPDGLIDIGEEISSEIVAGLVPGARVVKAFNTTPVPVLVAALGSAAGPDNAVYVAGDDPEAKHVVAELIASIGGEAVDTGDLHTGGRLQGMTGPLAGTLEMIGPAEARTRLRQATTP
jgi:predicted dinucleotide-binding enzyme